MRYTNPRTHSFTAAASVSPVRNKNSCIEVGKTPTRPAYVSTHLLRADTLRILVDDELNKAERSIDYNIVVVRDSLTHNR